MFAVQRYDPAAEDAEKTKTKKKRERNVLTIEGDDKKKAKGHRRHRRRSLDDEEEDTEKETGADDASANNTSARKDHKKRRKRRRHDDDEEEEVDTAPARGNGGGDGAKANGYKHTNDGGGGGGVGVEDGGAGGGRHRDRGMSVDSSSSSSVPSSTSSSSFADDDDDDDARGGGGRDGGGGTEERKERARPAAAAAAALRVIAPAQTDFTAGGAAKRRRRPGGVGRGGDHRLDVNDEAMDDLDLYGLDDGDENENENGGDDIGHEKEEDVVTSKERGANLMANDATRDDKVLNASEEADDDEIETALRMSSLPLLTAARHWNLPPFLLDNLQRDGYRHFFPIQSLVVPDVLASERHASIRGSRDVCCSAPTGSGKTLAFVLPVLNALWRRRVRRLRALVVLPSRDLATQVYDVFQRYADGSDLTIGLAIGQTDFATEQRSLIVGDVVGGGGASSSRAAGGRRRPRRSTPSSTCRLNDVDALRLRCAFDPTNVRAALAAYDGRVETEGSGAAPPTGAATNGTVGFRGGVSGGGRSAIDVLVATPGRLLDHVDKTPAFTLQHLRFLVIDEADRLVNQSYQNWIGRVLRATTYSGGDNDEAATADVGSSGAGAGAGPEGTAAVPPWRLAGDGLSYHLDPVTWRRRGTMTAGVDIVDTKKKSGVPSIAAEVSRPVPLRKLLFSATLTKDPRKLASLGLVNPKHFDAHQLKARLASRRSDNKSAESRADGCAAAPASNAQQQQRYSVPESLSEFTVECTAQQKPLVLLAILLEHGIVEGNQHLIRDDATSEDDGTGKRGIIIVFTSSVDSTHRLVRLLQLVWASAGYGPTSAIAEYSSALSQKQRGRLIRRCTAPAAGGTSNQNEQQVSVIVCSDGMSRGMDIPSASVVVNYDVPGFAKTYVHRCGRTARAGKQGRAISVLKGGQVGQFARMRQLVDGGRVEKMGVKKHLVSDAVPAYQACVHALRRVIDAEKEGELNPASPLDSSWIPVNTTRTEGSSLKRGSVETHERTSSSSESLDSESDSS